MTAPLDHAGIAALIPHQGAMCLLDGLVAWDAGRLHAVSTGHRAADHPLRTAHGLLATAAIEYAAQAMALHGALLARAAEAAAAPGMLVSARDVRLARWRLDDLPAVPAAIDVVVDRLAGDARQLLYAFELRHGDAPVASGRAAVMLQRPATGGKPAGPWRPPAPDGRPEGTWHRPAAGR